MAGAIFIPPLQRNGNAGVWQAAAEIYCAVNRIHHPPPLRRRITHDAFLAENRNLWIRFAQPALDHPLTLLIECQLNIMRGLLIDPFL